MRTGVENRGLPRVFDAVAAGGALAVTWPAIAAAALAVYVTSAGPVLFRQTRVGRRGVPFTMLKLRTMHGDARSARAYTAGDDPRITPVGRVLRKFKLDELPSLWNVVRGDMALVGPRPEVPRYVNLDDPLWREVLSVRPGLTDPVTLALRNEEDLLASVERDRDVFYRDHLQPWKLRRYARYVRERSPATDLRVLLGTALAVVRPSVAAGPTVEEVFGTTPDRTAHGDSA